jgi:hypothetical protein
MTDQRPVAPLPRPAPAATPGRLDEDFYDLVESRFVRLVRDNPVLGTSLGLHQDDDLLGDGSREAVLAELAADRTHLVSVEAIDPAALSDGARFERELELHNVRRAIFDADVLRLWERRSFALDHVGDSLFLLFARDHAQLPERLDAIAGRLEATATYLEESKTRATVPQVRLWQTIEIETASELPVFFDELVAAGVDVLPAAEQRRLERASESAKIAVELLKEEGANVLGQFPLSREFSGPIQGRDYQGPAGYRFFAAGGKAIAEGVKHGEVDWRDLNQAGGILFHYPALQVQKLADGISALEDGRTSNPVAPLFGVHKRR